MQIQRHPSMRQNDPTPSPSRQAGFSLVELLVALTLLAIALTSITSLYLGHHRVQLRLGQQWVAQSYLSERMERIRLAAPLEEGRTESKLGEEVEAPVGLPWEGGVLIQDVQEWSEGKDEERTQYVMLTLRWQWHKEQRTARLETLVGGATP